MQRLIPRIPDQIPIDDLFEENGKLLLIAQCDIDAIKSYLSSAGNGVYTKAELNRAGIKIPYNVIKCDDQYFVLYLGRRAGLAKFGGHGVVKWLQNLETSQWAAVKILSMSLFFLDNVDGSKSRDEIKRNAQDEKTQLAGMGQLLGWFERESPSKGYQVYLLMPYFPGSDLFEFNELLSKHHHDLTTAAMLLIIIKMCLLLEQLHARGFLHRDFKTENIMYDPLTGDMELVDVSNMVGIDEQKTLGECITVPLSAPEVFRDEYTVHSEIYALGMGILEMLKLMYADNWGRCHPIQSIEAFNINKKILDADMRRTILDFVSVQMCSMKPLRCSATAARQLFEGLHRDLSKEATVCCLDVKAYYAAQPTARQNMINLLKQYDHVVLINCKDYSITQIIQLQRELLANGVLVATHDFAWSQKKSQPKRDRALSINSIFAPKALVSVTDSAIRDDSTLKLKKA